MVAPSANSEEGAFPNPGISPHFESKDPDSNFLEYSLVKKEWYLLWYHINHRAMMNTKLEKIESIQELSISPERVAQIGLDIEKLLQKRLK